MKIKFIDHMPPKRGPKSKYPWAEFIEELYKHPNRWAEFPMLVAHSITAYNVSQRFADIEVSISGGNNFAIDNPNKKDWTVYLRYVPKTGPQSSE
jgi:hypothetical protein